MASFSFLISILAVVGVIASLIDLIIVNTSNFQQSIQSSYRTFYFDKKFIPIMNKISNRVPQNETIVMSFISSSLLDYFIKSNIEIPYGVSSLGSLEDYMTERNLKWLLVYENVSHSKDLEPLFRKEGLRKLESIFQEIDNYSTEDMSKFHLYKLKI